MVANRPYILYSLPISRTTQALKGNKIEKVWLNVQNFLEACTNADIENPNNIYLCGYTADKIHGEQPEQAEKLIEKAKSTFGEGITEPIGYLYPENVPLEQTQITWQLKPTDLGRAVKFLIDLQPQPKYNLGPIELIISYDFKLIDPLSKKELLDQQYDSSLLIWLTRSNCVSPNLCFPFIRADQDFLNYIDKIEETIPFKFDIKYLRLGKANKKGTANIFSKL